MALYITWSAPAANTFGLTCQGRRAGLWDSLLALPRIEIRGDEDFADFVLKLEGE